MEYAIVCSFVSFAAKHFSSGIQTSLCLQLDPRTIPVRSEKGFIPPTIQACKLRLLPAMRSDSLLRRPEKTLEKHSSSNYQTTTPSEYLVSQKTFCLKCASFFCCPPALIDNIQFRLLSKPCSVIRSVTVDTAERLDKASESSSLDTRLIISMLFRYFLLNDSLLNERSSKMVLEVVARVF